MLTKQNEKVNFYNPVFFLTINSFANPVAPPKISISELFFKESGDWIIEIEYIGVRHSAYPIDSIILFTSSGKTELPILENDGDGIYILSNDSLKDLISINRFGDSLYVRTYFEQDPYIIDKELVFGNWAGATIGYPQNGQSLWKYEYFENYFKNNKPSLGTFNDWNDEGIFGSLEGIVFDKFTLPLSKKELILHSQYERSFITHSDGYYQIKIYAKETVIDHVVYQLGERKYQTIPIDSIQFTMEPDSVVYRDIYLHDALQTGIDEISLRDSPVKIYPNPANRQGWLNYEVSLPVRSSECRLELYSTDGRLLVSVNVTEPSGKINLPDTNGPLLARFSVNQKIVYSNKILVQ